MARTAERSLRRPAFYALRPGGWRDLLTLLHPPYTAWHLSYVAIGAAVAPAMRLDRLGWALLGFFLGVGVCAHALDELHDRPLRTSIPTGALKLIATGSLILAVGIGLFGALTVSLTIVPLVVAGAFIVLAYNLELFGSRFHSDVWFAVSWGAFPAFAGFWVCSLKLDASAVLAVSACFALSVAQRRLSTPVRALRRRTISLDGRQEMADGAVLRLDPAQVSAPMEAALKASSAAIVLLAAALVLARL